MPGLPPPLPPLDAWPRHFVDEPGRVYGWHLAPRTVVFQFGDELISLAMAQAVVGAMEAVLYPRREEIRALGGLRVVHDARQVRQVSAEAFSFLRSVWGRLQAADIERGYLVNDGRIGILARSVLTTLNLVAMLTTQRPMILVPTLEEPFARFAIDPPGVEHPFPTTR